MNKNWWTPDASITNVATTAPARKDEFPLTPEMLLNSPSGDLFGMMQDVGMGCDGKSTTKTQALIMTTIGGMRNEDGSPLAMGYHTGHWELGLLAKAAAERFKQLNYLPFAAHCSDPCDGRSQGTPGMMESLAYRNSACEVIGRLIRSLPRARAVMGIATCDKGLPAMMMALAENSHLPGIIVPGGVSLPPDEGEDAGTIQSIGTRYAHEELSLKEASELGCAACASPGGGCQFLGTAATAQVISEALGMSIPHSALAPSGQAVWLDMAKHSTDALCQLQQKSITLNQILSRDSLHNAMAVHAAFGGSSNLLLHLPAVVYMAGVQRPTVNDWETINRQVPRIVDVLPNGPNNFRTVQVYLAGAVPEVMLHLRDMAVLKLDAMTVTGKTIGDNLADWEQSDRRRIFKEHLHASDGIDSKTVIMTANQAQKSGLRPTLIFPKGNLTPDGSVVKSTAISNDLFVDGIYRHRGRVRFFTNEKDAINAVRSTGEDRIIEGDVIALTCRGPIGAGMPETAQITIALKYTKSLKNIVLLTDGRFSGFSSGPCIGHIGPEALAEGPIGKLQNGDIVELILNNNELSGTLQLLGDSTTEAADLSIEVGDKLLAVRTANQAVKADPRLPDSVKLWAALQKSGGGIWGGCVYDVDNLLDQLKS